MRKEPRSIELLSPAKDLICGREAINHGADAVYIGAPKFGARAAAGNTLDDIRQLCDYAHLYSARIYVALNTILKEEELAEAEQMIWQLYEAGADALIVHDMGITQLNLPPIPLHANTTCVKPASSGISPSPAYGYPFAYWRARGWAEGSTG